MYDNHARRIRIQCDKNKLKVTLLVNPNYFRKINYYQPIAQAQRMFI